MFRVVLINLLMFMLPFLVYGAYFYLVRQGRDAADFWVEAPLKSLLAVSVVLVVGAIAGLIHFSGGDREGTYIPPRFEDGVIKPGRIE